MDLKEGPSEIANSGVRLSGDQKPTQSWKLMSLGAPWTQLLLPQNWYPWFFSDEVVPLVVIVEFFTVKKSNLPIHMCSIRSLACLPKRCFFWLIKPIVTHAIPLFE